LALELSDGAQRLIVNCGGPGLAPSDLSDELIDGLRTTAAHSTLTIDDSNSTSIQPDGALGKGVDDVIIDRSEDNDSSRLEATHTADGMGAILRSSGAPPWNFRCRGANLGIEESIMVDGTGRPVPTTQLVIAGEVSHHGGEVAWQLRRSS